MRTAFTNEELAAKIEELAALKQVLERQLRFELVVVTPDLAKRWLERNLINRGVDFRRSSYARQMLEGVWNFNGQPIIFSDTNLLLDGGGRLTGVVTSNVPILCTVIYGVPEDAFKTMDSIKARTIKDVLEASHLLDGETKTVKGYVASMGKRIMEWGSERYGSHGNSTTRTVANSLEVLSFIQENLAQMRDCAKAAAGMGGAHREKLLSKKDYFGSFMGYLTILKGWDFADVHTFFNELTDCRSVIRGDGHPIATLRRYLIRSYGRNKEIKITDKELFHMFARAWNEYCKNGEIKRFSLKSCTDVPMSKFEVMSEMKK